MGLQAAVHLGHMPWALTKEEEDHSFKNYGGMKHHVQTIKR
jgi:hypothetical protein